MTRTIRSRLLILTGTLACLLCAPRAEAGRVADAAARAVSEPIKKAAESVTQAVSSTGKKVQSHLTNVGKTVARTVRRGVQTVAQGVGAVASGGLGPLVSFVKDLGFPAKLGSPEALLRAFATLGDAGLRAVEGAYQLGLGKVPFMPSLDTIRGVWKTAQTVTGTLVSGKGLGDGVSRVIEKVMAELTELVPKVIEKFTAFREGVRKLLVLELKSPFEENKAVQDEIDRVAKGVLEPLTLVLAGSLKKVVPAAVVDEVVRRVRKPMLALWSFMMRGLIFGRSVVKQAVRLVLPRLIEGAAGAARWVKKLKPPPVVEQFLLAALDQLGDFFGGAASFFLTLVPDLKATVEQVLDAVVGAADDVRSVTGTLGGASRAKTPLDMLRVMAGASAAGGGGEAGAAAPTKVDPAAVKKARADVRAAERAARALEEAFEKADLAALRAKVEGKDPAAKAAAERAREALDKANETLFAARTALLRADPEAATERVIHTVWERLSEAFLKVVWDGGSAIGDLVVTAMNRLSLLASQVSVAAAGGVGGVFVVTIDWVPLLAELAGTVMVTGGQILAETSRNLFNSVVLPELRTLVKDQLVDYGSLFVTLWKDPRKRKELQFLGTVLNRLFAALGPFEQRLRRARDTVKAGAAALYAGPLGGLFKELPPQLFAAISKAVTTGTELLQKLAIQGAAALGKAVARAQAGAPGERRLTPEDIAKLIIAEVKEPVIDYLTGLLPDEPGLDDLKKALAGGLGAAADRLARSPSPAKLLHPSVLPSLLGDGLLGAKEGLGAYLAGQWKVPGLAGVIEGAIGRVATLLQTGGLKAEVLRVLRGGPLGIVREILSLGEPGKKSLRDFLIDDLLLKDAPADLVPELREALVKAFALVEEPGTLSSVLRGGLRGIVAKAVELAHPTVLKLLLRDFPEGPVTQALREVLLALGEEASSADSPIFTKLAQGGLAGIAGLLLAKEKVAGALAEVLTADLAEAGDLQASLRGAIARTGETLATGGLSATFQKSGVRSLLVDFGKPVAEYLITRLCAGLDASPALRAAVRSLLLAAVDDLADAKTFAEALRNVPQRFLGRLRAYAEKLSVRVQSLAKAEVAALRAALASLVSAVGSSMGTPRMLTEANAVLVAIAARLGAAGVSLPSVEEVLR